MILLTHLGHNIPSYVEDCFSQIRLVNPHEEVLFIKNKDAEGISESTFRKYKVDTVPAEDYRTKEVDAYTNNTDLSASIEYGSAEYWCVTQARLWYLYEFTRRENIHQYFYFENDVLLYENTTSIQSIIDSNNLYRNQIAITRGGDNKIMTGFMYVDKADLLGDVIDSFRNTASKTTEELNENYYFDNDMINEMFLLSCYQYDNPDKMRCLPIFPEGKYSENFEYFDSIFDPASYGQILGGTPHQEGSVYAPDHIIPKVMGVDKDSNVVIYEFAEPLSGETFLLPFLIYENKEYKINNLHIHYKYPTYKK